VARCFPGSQRIALPRKSSGEMIGKTFSHYRIIEKLGEGGMGVVYKAEDTRLERTVALKFLSSQSLGTTEEKARFVREAKAAAILDHPSICTIHEIDEDEGQTFIAMAYVNGQSLQERIGAGPLNVDDAVRVAVQIAKGLREAHENGIVHRDIKSGNIMVDKRGQTKILDFGLAKCAGRTQLTKTATIMGTVAYMSPEQARGDAVDHRTDIWSLGVVLYEMLTGALPFNAENEVALIHNILYENPAEVTIRNPNVPPGLGLVVSRAMAKKREERYPNISEFLDDIRNFRALRPEEPQFLSSKTFADDRAISSKAEKRVRSKILFYRHLEFFLAINFLLLMINLLTSAGHFWFRWPLFGLSIPLFIHWVMVFGFSRRTLLRERLMEREKEEETMRKDRFRT